MSNDIRNKGEEYPFMMANIDAEDKPGTRWQSFLDIEEKDSIFLFSSFGILGLLNFIVENNELIFNKVIKEMKNIFIKDKKILMLKSEKQVSKAHAKKIKPAFRHSYLLLQIS